MKDHGSCAVLAAAAAMLAAFACGLVVRAPATLFDRLLAGVSDGRVRLVAARGTIWSGTGRLEARARNAAAEAAATVGWRLRPAALLHGRLAYDVTLDGGKVSVAVIPWARRVALSGGRLELPARALAAAARPLEPLHLTGRLHVDISEIVLETQAMQGEMLVRWQDAGSAVAPVSPLGSYELRIRGQGETARVELGTLHGPLELKAAGSWVMRSAPDFPVTARVAAEHRESLAPFLRLVAVERGDGSFTLQAWQATSPAVMDQEREPVS